MFDGLRRVVAIGAGNLDFRAHHESARSASAAVFEHFAGEFRIAPAQLEYAVVPKMPEELVGPLGLGKPAHFLGMRFRRGIHVLAVEFDVQQNLAGVLFLHEHVGRLFRPRTPIAINERHLAAGLGKRIEVNIANPLRVGRG